MPIPKPTSNETKDEFISRCISSITDEYDQEQSAAICYSTWEKENMTSDVSEEQQQGGVVSAGFGSTFSYQPKNKEKLSDFMGRCMADSKVREKKQDRVGRAAFCYGEYRNNYIMSIAKSWK